MPYLNWKEHSIGRSMHHPQGGDERAVVQSVAKMQLDLDSSELATLTQGLEQVFESGGELRLDLPEQWIVFWKKRPSDTRLLLAHPQLGEWVATVALEETHAQSFVAALKKLSSSNAVGEGVSVHEVVESGVELYEPGSVNNLELRVTLK